MELLVSLQELLNTLSGVLVLVIYIYALYKGILAYRIRRDLDQIFADNSEPPKPA